MDMIIQQLSHRACHTQLCLHWYFAHLSAVVELGACAVVAVHISPETCLYHERTQCLTSRSAQHSSPTHHAFWPCSQSAATVCSKRQAPNRAYVDVQHICALWWNWVHVLWWQCPSVTRCVCKFVQVICITAVSQLLLGCIEYEWNAVCQLVLKFWQDHRVLLLYVFFQHHAILSQTVYISLHIAFCFCFWYIKLVWMSLLFWILNILNTCDNLLQTWQPSLMCSFVCWLPAAQYMTFKKISPQQEHQTLPFQPFV